MILSLIGLIVIMMILIVWFHTLEPQKILFVCGGNTGRSVIAAGLLNQNYALGKTKYNAFSRGVNVNPRELRPEPNAVGVMNEKGIDIRAHRASPLEKKDLDSAAFILAMTQVHKEKILASSPESAQKIKLLSEYADGTFQDIEDAYGRDLDFYRHTRDQIETYIQAIISRDGKVPTR